MSEEQKKAIIEILYNHVHKSVIREIEFEDIADEIIEELKNI